MKNAVNFPQKKNTPVDAGFGWFRRRNAEKTAFFCEVSIKAAICGSDAGRFEKQLLFTSQ